jgi:hypothetical protein
MTDQSIHELDEEGMAVWVCPIGTAEAWHSIEHHAGEPRIRDAVAPGTEQVEQDAIKL